MAFALAANTTSNSLRFGKNILVQRTKSKALIMDGRVQNLVESCVTIQEVQQQLLGNEPKPQKTPGQKAIRKTFKMSAHLANLLPSGTVLMFQLLAPAVTHKGHCQTITSQLRTLALLSVCSFLCILLSFTDSFRDERGKVHHGLATFKGLWVIDGAVAPGDVAKYRIRCIDFFHAFLSVLVFAAVTLFDQKIVSCFCPSPSEEAKELLVGLPIGVGVVCSLLFVAFPSKRHGIGFPLSRH